MGICGSNNHVSTRSFRISETEAPSKAVLRDVSGLPEDWVAYIDRQANKVYYQNNIYKTTQWEKPLREVPVECTRQLPFGWTAQIDKRTGQVFWQNHQDLSTQWTKPKPLALNMGSRIFTKSEESFIGLFEKAKSQNSVFEFGECAVCFEELFENRPTVLIDGRRRVCRHFICNICANNLIEEQDLQCPLCRAAFSSIKILPDIRKYPKDWYDICDQDATGELTRQELADALTVILPIQQSRIEKDLDTLWNTWDHDNSTKIKWERAATTVIPYVIRKMDLPQFQKGVIPNLLSIEEQSKWFDYWDLDGNGILDKQELARALLKTFELHMTKKQVRKLVTNLLGELWGVLVGENKDSINIKEFTMEDGFGTTISVTLREAMSKSNEELDSSSSVVLIPALSPPYEQSGNVKKIFSSSSSLMLGSPKAEQKQWKGNDSDFYGYFTAPIATSKRLAMDESDSRFSYQV